ncbi:DUF2271 domain-containing protein [Sphingomonas sp.]|uniref:DUF2271 domain-containing protein n=1 Tax=Sphingomonas sp. TaxID=28214 RepID=UPI002C647693|nr:DUF2271 domain-containing protein [Sphingomonas sp.]HWK34985.1 DUF2271 domain-containing protein [Sphingomonas sp.]
MQLTHRLILTGLPIAAVAAAPAVAQTMDVTLNIPRLKVAEYHAPYVALWLEKAGQPARTLTILYDYDNRENGGKKWLTDLRQWWRASGRSLTLPADGVSGATRPPGAQKLSFTAGRGTMGTLAPGDYTLLVEAARETGGREVVRVPFSWPPKRGQTASATGQFELGQVSLSFR